MLDCIKEHWAPCLWGQTPSHLHYSSDRQLIVGQVTIPIVLQGSVLSTARKHSMLAVMLARLTYTTQESSSLKR